MLKIGDILNLSDDELREKETGLRKELMQLRFQAKTGKLERQSAMKEAKRSIARILTVLNQRKSEEGQAVKPAVKKEKTVAKKAETQKTAKLAKPAKKTEAKAEKTSKVKGKKG